MNSDQPKPAPTAEEQLAERISEIESRIAAITKGPWELRRGFSDWGMACQHDIVVGEDHIAGIPSVTPYCIGERSKVKHEAANQWGVAQFIAAAPEDIRFLLDSLLAALRSNREKDAQYQTLNDVVLAKCVQVKELYAELAEKDAKIAELKAECELAWGARHEWFAATGEANRKRYEVEAQLRAVSEALKEELPVTLLECPAGLFVFNRSLGLKTEYAGPYGGIEVYVAESGEFFWGGTSDANVRDALLVRPVSIDFARLRSIVDGKDSAATNPKALEVVHNSQTER